MFKVNLAVCLISR